MAKANKETRVVKVDNKKYDKERKDRRDRERTRKVKKGFIEFLKDEGGGNISFACRKLGINRSNIYKWRDASKRFKNSIDKAVDTGKETLADEAEVSLRSSVRRGDSRSIIFTLKNLRPKQWRDSQVVEHEGKIEVEGVSDELKKAAKETYDKFRKNIRKQNTKAGKKK